MAYESIRKKLTDFNFNALPQLQKNAKEQVFSQMDTIAEKNPSLSSYALKEKLYDALCGAAKPILFEEIPFYFETGLLTAFSDGKFNRGGVIHANGWLYLRNQHLFEDVDAQAYARYQINQSNLLYAQTGEYVDIMHMGIPLKRCFAVGLSGIYADLVAEEKLARTAEEHAFISCAKKGIEALHTLQCSFARTAQEKGMIEVADVASRVPWQPPQTFHEGLCTMAFMRKALGALEGVGFGSFGRVDVLLEPLYVKDKARGICEAELLELVSKFLLIWDCCLDRSKKFESGFEYELENSLTLGGTDENGAGVFNGVTKLFLQARNQLQTLYPKMMLRVSSAMTDEQLELFTEPLYHGQSYSIFENDDVMIPALMQAGVDAKDAAQYAVGGCWDVITPDVSTKFSGEYINILRILEWAVHRQTDKMRENGLVCTVLDDVQSFEELYQRYIAAVEDLMKIKFEAMAHGAKQWHKVNPICTVSALMPTCVEKRRDLTAGGGKYNWECAYFVGFPEVVDSLLAIRYICFEQKYCTIEQLLSACRENWQNEILRQYAVNAPSYGDGSEMSSAFAGRLYDDLYAMTLRMPTAYGGKVRMGFHLYTETVRWGKQIAATPNGRRHGDYISQGITPSRIQNKVSAFEMLDSLRFMDMKKCGGNASMSPSLPAGKITHQQLVLFLRAAMRSGAQAIQPNCVHLDDLRAAQKHPEKYGHLIVRVCGFSAPFVLLSQAYQEEFIQRGLYEM